MKYATKVVGVEYFSDLVRPIVGSNVLLLPQKLKRNLSSTFSELPILQNNFIGDTKKWYSTTIPCLELYDIAFVSNKT